MIEVIDNEKDWKQVLLSCDSYDFYHTYDYHLISKKEDELPILITYRENDKTIAIPFLKRTIDNTAFFDLTSVYGYAGPIYKNIDASFNNDLFRTELEQVFSELSIVSVFSRLHPYLKKQSIVLNNLGQTPTLGKVVNINLTLPLDEQRMQYGKSTKNRTNKCRRLCNVVLAKTDEQINSFIDVYYENMDRLSANKDYYFSRKYFFDFLKCTDFETDILLVQLEETGEVIAGSMFVKTNDIVQFHLSGTRNSALNLAPANLFLDEMRVKATEQDYKIFNLGGGVGSKEDSLFKFKSSFSKEHHEFKVWKHIVNNNKYLELIGDKEIDVNEQFFPLYRK